MDNSNIPRCHCGSVALHSVQMLTHQCQPILMCNSCLHEHEETAQEVNEHEMRRFGGAYGLVDYTVDAISLPLSVLGGDK